MYHSSANTALEALEEADFSKVEREMVQLASDVGMSYQQLYIRFFEQQSESLNSLGHWWQTAIETTRKQLGDTRRRP